MADPTAPAIRIGRLRLRVPGSGAAAGRRVAEGVVRRLAQTSTHLHFRGGIGALRVRVRASPGEAEGEMSAGIVTAVANAMAAGRSLTRRGGVPARPAQ